MTNIIWTSEDGQTRIEYDAEYDLYFLHSSMIDTLELSSNGVYRSLRGAKTAATRLLNNIN